MKKLTLLALIAMMLISMLAFSACKAKEEVVEEEVVEEVQDAAATVDTLVQDVEAAAEATPVVPK